MTLLAAFKFALVLLLVFIIFNLARALLILVKGESKQAMSHFLGKRVAFSALLMFCLLVALATGFVEPNPRPY